MYRFSRKKTDMGCYAATFKCSVLIYNSRYIWKKRKRRSALVAPVWNTSLKSSPYRGPHGLAYLDVPGKKCNKHILQSDTCNCPLGVLYCSPPVLPTRMRRQQVTTLILLSRKISWYWPPPSNIIINMPTFHSQFRLLILFGIILDREARVLYDDRSIFE